MIIKLVCGGDLRIMITVNMWLFTIVVLHCIVLQRCAVWFIGLIYPESFKANQIRTTDMSLGWNSQRDDL